MTARRNKEDKSAYWQRVDSSNRHLSTIQRRRRRNRRQYKSKEAECLSRLQQHPVLTSVLLVQHLLVDDPAGLLDGLLKPVAEHRPALDDQR